MGHNADPSCMGRRITYDGHHRDSSISERCAGCVQGTCQQAAVMLQHLQDNADGCARVHGGLDHACERLLYDVLILALQLCAYRVIRSS